MKSYKERTVIVGKRMLKADVKALRALGIEPSDLIEDTINTILRGRTCPCCKRPIGGK